MAHEFPVFVYGTLMSGFSNAHKYVSPYEHQIIPAKVKGKLYHLPEGYPALIQNDDQDEWTYGEILFFATDCYQKALAGLDELEDFFGEGHENNLYERVLIHAYSQDESIKYEVFVYRMEGLQARRTERRGIAVPSGDWRKFMIHKI